ncbi:MAG: hypothetical protein HY043_10810 [Verrucomicrobia bacterium]|nr:hypothetical protein [Verrucomicrobiota bacterium]
MNIAELQKKLVAAAQAKPLDNRVPYAFEKRIMARLAPAARLDPWMLWSGALWRAAAPCVAIMLLALTWSFFEAGTDKSSVALDVALENTVLAATDTTGEAW